MRNKLFEYIFNTANKLREMKLDAFVDKVEKYNLALDGRNAINALGKSFDEFKPDKFMDDNEIEISGEDFVKDAYARLKPKYGIRGAVVILYSFLLNVEDKFQIPDKYRIVNYYVMQKKNNKYEKVLIPREIPRVKSLQLYLAYILRSFSGTAKEILLSELDLILIGIMDNNKVLDETESNHDKIVIAAIHKIDPTRQYLIADYSEDKRLKRKQ